MKLEYEPPWKKYRMGWNLSWRVLESILDAYIDAIKQGYDENYKSAEALKVKAYLENYFIYAKPFWKKHQADLRDGRVIRGPTFEQRERLRKLKIEADLLEGKVAEKRKRAKWTIPV